IHSSADWKRTLISLGNRAEKENRIAPAIGYYRMSEFFMEDSDPDKLKYYQRATDMFYEYYRDYFAGEAPVIERHSVAYEGIQLPVWHLRPEGKPKDTILLHGGNDSYMEEFLFSVLYLRECGFEVYLFEGPGQGGVVRMQGKHFTHQWERPVKAVLDHFGLAHVTIIGISLGGYLAPRAAAFDKRISKVVCWSVFPSFLGSVIGTQGKALETAFYVMMKLRARPLLNLVFGLKCRKDPMVNWAIRHGMFAYEADSPYDWAKKLERYDIRPVAGRLTQDVLILGASADHFIDYHKVSQEIDAMVNVRSLTFRLFTKQESAADHCQVGNARLALDTIMQWITETNRKNAKIGTFRE
ncbi:MAG: alpha/beta fold hydrolase, partial [Oscillospiraceae bacterium]|nr:alpha/beta fold hydrolase [Oscillospiraceae bacterium]